MREPAVYMLGSKPNGTVYIGVTSDLVQRAWQHKEKLVAGFTSRYGVASLVWYEMHATMEYAIHREKRLKKYTRQQKLRLIQATNPEWKDLYEEICG